jgi:hypothetical protein
MIEESSQEIYVGNLLKRVETTVDPEATAGIQSGLDHQELQGLVNSLVKLPEDNPPPSPVKVTRITHHQIAAMRSTQSKMPAAVKEPAVKQKALFQTIDAFKNLFRGAEKRSRCQIDGHQCKHCGQTIKNEEKPGAIERGH